MGCLKLSYYNQGETLEENPFFTERGLEKKGCALKKRVDYYPFGSVMPQRDFTSNEYRYGFNGMLKDSEIKGEGNSYSTEFRQYDPRLGKWFSIDPLASDFSWQSPYVGMDNNPVALSDPFGLSTDWVERNGEIVWDENVTSADDEDLQAGDRYVGKEGHGINEVTGDAIHYKSDGTKREYAQTFSDLVVTPGASYSAKNPSNSSNNKTGYIYSEKDLSIRNSVVDGSGDPIERAILSLEREGNFQPLYRDEYIAMHGRWWKFKAWAAFSAVAWQLASPGQYPVKLNSTKGFKLNYRGPSNNVNFANGGLKNPKSIWGKSVDDIVAEFREAGYKVNVSQSTKGSMRSTQIQIIGHSQISNIQVHPGGGRHVGAYYKISTSTMGKIKVVDPSTYVPTLGEKAKIIYYNW